MDTEAAFLAARIQDVLRGGTATAPATGETSATLEVSDGTEISEAGGTVFISHGGAPEPLTSRRVTVSNVSFQNTAIPDTPDIIQVQFTVTASPSGQPASGASYSHDYTTTIGIR